MKTLLTKPLFWLVAQAVLLVVAFWFLPVFQLVPGSDWDKYWAEYDEFTSLRSTLSCIRTVGYPVFLRAVYHFSPELKALPLWHLAIHLVAVFAFYGGLQRVRISGWLSLAVASTLLYTNVVLIWGVYILSDALGSSLAVLTMACLLHVVGRPGSLLAWPALLLSLFLTLQVRPAYLFLLGLVPLLGVLLLAIVQSPPDWLRLRWRVGLGLLAVCFGPFLAFCTLRYAVTGHFGLVSFGGFNIIGIAGQFLTDDVVPDLPADLRPLAEYVLEKRKEAAAAQQPPPGTEQPPPPEDQASQEPADPADPMEMPPTPGPHLVPHPAGADSNRVALEKERGRGAPKELIEQLDIVLYLIWGESGFHPATVEVYQTFDHVVVNDRLTRISIALIKARPLRYAKYVVQAFRWACIMTVVDHHLIHVLLVVLVALLTFWHLRFVWHRLRARPDPLDQPVVPVRSFRHELNVLGALGVSFALCKMVLVALVQPPDARYMEPAAVFLPGILVVAIAMIWVRIWPAAVPSGTSTAVNP